MPSGGDLETLGQRVRRLRLTNGLTQDQLAVRMRVTQARVSQIESRGSSGPLPMRTLCDLADGLGVDLDTLIAGDPMYEFFDQQDLASPTSPLFNLPRIASPFIDRAADLAAIVSLVRSDHRVVTLVGPAGVGKTQLALHVAQELQADYPDQIAVSIATCVDMASVLTIIARAISLHERDARPLRERLVTALRDRRLLLLLDNVEQALPAVSTLVAELAAACPHLRLLATSRAPLKIRVEQTYTVYPLGLPEIGAAVTLAAAAAPAVQMFVQHARVAVHGFSLTESNAANVTAICRRLDGLPLAIELAAPRTRVMTLDQLLRQLDRRLTLLTSGSRELPARQQSLRASIAWSFDLLTPAQQTLFRRVAVFADGFTLEAAIEVASDDPGRTATSPAISWSSLDVANGVSILLEQSLLTRTEQADGVPRFGMLETIHEFAREQLEVAGEAEKRGRQHLAWCLSLAEQSVPKMFTVDEPAWLARLEQEDANLQAALGFAFAPGRDADLEAGLRLAGALADYWFLCGLLSEGRAWLMRAIDLSVGRAPSIGRARCLVGACLIEQTQAAVEPALIHGEQGLTLAESLDDEHTIGRALLFLGNLAMMQGKFSHAHSLHEKALACFWRLGDQAWTAVALINLGMDFYRQGHRERAIDCAEDALAITRAIGSLWDTTAALRLLGDVARDRGDLEQATGLFTEILILGWRHGNEREVADSLSGMGTVAVASGDLERAARLFGAAETLYRRLEITIPPPLRPDWGAIVDRIREGLASECFAKNWSSTPEQVILEAIGRRHPDAG